jgi:hypothetical protein
VPLIVRTIANGRAYIDIPGTIPPGGGTSKFASSDDTFADGIVASRNPDAAASRISFMPRPGATLRAFIAGGSVTIVEVSAPSPKPSPSPSAKQ